jgi:hypothetical protein
MRRLMAFALMFALLGGLTEQAFAWQSSQNYQGDTLFGQPNGKAWSPIRGVLSGKVYWENQQRRTMAQASGHAWSQAAIDWMRQNSGTPSITFHIFDYVADNCTNWTAIGWAGSDLPGATYTQPLRWCGYNETRVQADKTRLVANKDYIAQVIYYDKSPRTRAKVVVDTYWNGDGNYHQHYCIPDNLDTVWGRNNCG